MIKSRSLCSRSLKGHWNSMTWDRFSPLEQLGKSVIISNRFIFHRHPKNFHVNTFPRSLEVWAWCTRCTSDFPISDTDRMAVRISLPNREKWELANIFFRKCFSNIFLKSLWIGKFFIPPENILYNLFCISSQLFSPLKNITEAIFWKWKHFQKLGKSCSEVGWTWFFL